MQPQDCELVRTVPLPIEKIRQYQEKVKKESNLCPHGRVKLVCKICDNKYYGRVKLVCKSRKSS